MKWLLVIMVVLAGKPAWGVEQFKREWERRYVGNEQTKAQIRLGRLSREARCNICHEGTEKRNRNVYGRALAKLLNRRTDAQNPDKIQSALKAVESEPGVTWMTFGRVMKAGALPATVPTYSYRGDWNTSKPIKLQGQMDAILRPTTDPMRWRIQFSGIWEGAPYAYDVVAVGDPKDFSGTARIDQQEYRWRGWADQTDFRANFLGRYQGGFQLQRNE